MSMFLSTAIRLLRTPLTVSRRWTPPVILLALVGPSVYGQDFPWRPPAVGPTELSPTPKRYSGVILERQDETGTFTTVRSMRYVVGSLPADGEAAARRAYSGYGEAELDDRLLSAIDLQSGYVYFNVDHAPTLTADETRSAIGSQPDLYIPIIVDCWKDRGVLAGVDDDALEELKHRLITSVRSGAAEDLDRPVAAERSVVTLARHITREHEGSRPADVRSMIEAAATDAAIQNVISGLAFPFILTRRLTGGAEGTEGVVYVDEVGDDVTIHWFYFHSEHENQNDKEQPRPCIVIQGERHPNDGCNTQTIRLSPGEGVSISLTRAQCDEDNPADNLWRLADDGVFTATPIEEMIRRDLELEFILCHAAMTARNAGLIDVDETFRFGEYTFPCEEPPGDRP